MSIYQLIEAEILILFVNLIKEVYIMFLKIVLSLRLRLIFWDDSQNDGGGIFIISNLQRPFEGLRLLVKAFLFSSGSCKEDSYK